MGVAFEPFLKARRMYIDEKRSDGMACMENLIKNEIGVRRLHEDCPEYFEESNKGRYLEFHQGKFLGWRDELIYDPKLKSVTGYEI